MTVTLKPLSLMIACLSPSLWAQSPYQAGPDGDAFADSARVYQQGQTGLDWLPLEQMTEEQKALCRRGCQGAYVAPVRTDADAGRLPEQSPVRASADSSRLSDGSVAELTGNVALIQGYRSLTADRVIYDQASETAEIEGHVVLREPGLLMMAERLRLDQAQGLSQLSSSQFVLHDAQLRGQADQVTVQRQQGEGSFQFTDGQFTMCQPGDNTWSMSAHRIDIDNASGQGEARDLTLRLSDVPVFYTPWLRFPASDKRMTGLLFPSIGHSSRNGVEYAQPVYLNLAPNYDMTLTPRYLQHRGLGLEVEARHLSPLFDTVLGGAWLGDDQGGKNDTLQEQADEGLIDQSEVTPYKGEDRWLVMALQKGGRGPWQSLIDYTEVSDIDYLRDMNTSSLETNVSTHLRQSGSAGYQLGAWNLGVKAEAYQTVVEGRLEPYRQLPRFDLNGAYKWSQWSLTLNNQLTNFGHRDDYWDQDTELPDDPRILGQRLRADYKLAWGQRWIWGFLTPALYVKHLQYALEEDALKADANEAPVITGGQASLDGGLYFDRAGQLFGQAYEQTFEPRLFYFYSPEQDHSDLYRVSSANRSVQFDTSDSRFRYAQLFRDSRFNGYDRIDDANQLSVGLTSRFIESGVERLSLSLGQIFYFADRQVTLSGVVEDQPRSEIAARAGAQIGDFWRYALDMAWSEQDKRTSQASTSLRYQHPDGLLFNVGYSYRRKDTITDPDTGELYDGSINQTDIGLVYPIGQDWSLFARSLYDLALNRELDSFVGVEYNSCCYRMRLAGRRWRDSRNLTTVGATNLDLDRGIFLEFQLKGLGTLGEKMDQMLREGIIGFDRRPQYEP